MPPASRPLPRAGRTPAIPFPQKNRGRRASNAAGKRGRGREPRRTCVGCRAVREQRQLVRLVADGSGGVAATPQRAAGRGAYVCPSLSCLEEALRRKVLPRALRAELPRLDASEIRRRIEAERTRLSGVHDEE